MTTDIYISVTYDQYKLLEEAVKHFSELETTHESGALDARFYHKSMRLPIGDLTLEIHGPLVKP